MIAFHPNYVHPLPENHRFPMEKYDLLPKQLLHEGTVHESDFFEPQALSDKNLLDVHCPIYWNRLLNLELSDREQRVSGFKHSNELIEREITIMEGTRMAAELALKNKLGFNIAGGTHHAFYERGEGFCLLNDQVIASRWLLNNSGIKNILIIDLDVHQGNGTASILQNENRVFTFSMHGENNYPMQKEKSDLDVPLKDGIADKEYLYLLESNLESILTRFKPDFIFYQCGVDILETDKLGKLAVSMGGCSQRDRLVFETARQLIVPVVCSMGGGYSPQLKHIIEAHANTFRIGLDVLS
jgi:acetoin utilization deacetylase AcuC-like enzyme